MNLAIDYLLAILNPQTPFNPLPILSESTMARVAEAADNIPIK